MTNEEKTIGIEKTKKFFRYRLRIDRGTDSGLER